METIQSFTPVAILIESLSAFPEKLPAKIFNVNGRRHLMIVDGEFRERKKKQNEANRT